MLIFFAYFGEVKFSIFFKMGGLNYEIDKRSFSKVDFYINNI